MSRLKLYAPVAAVAPATISFVDAVSEMRPGRRPTRWTKATCPDCEGRRVQVVTLNDAERDDCGRPVEGTATVVGHHCVGCEREWPVMPRAEGCG